MVQTKIKNIELELQTYRRRVLVAAIFVLFLSAVLVTRYAYLQIDKHEEFSTEADENRILTEPIPPARGLISTRDGELIAMTRPSYTVSIVPERVDDLDEMLRDLEQFITISDRQKQRFKRKLDERRRPYSPVILRYELTEEEIARIVVQRHALEGVEVAARSVRYYPYDDLFAHTLGYVGRINEREAATINAERYAGTLAIGKTGIEKTWEDELMGFPGQQEVEINARGRVLRVLDSEAPIAGSDLMLTLDMQVQQAAFFALQGRRGSAVAIDINTGEVLAMVSTPSFNPNLFVTGISHTDYKLLVEDLDSPMFNRAIQARYPPGSTVKPEIGLAGLYYNIVDRDTEILDQGYFTLPHDDHRYRDWKPQGHGSVNFVSAMAQSCDTYYYHLAHEMGIDRYAEFLGKFGFGQLTGIDLPQERSGILPSRDWKRTYRGRTWYPGDTINAGIGQGFFLATPLQLANATAIIASRGKRFKPHMVKRIMGATIEEIHPESLIPLEVDEADWDTVFTAMHEVTSGLRGTARALSLDSAYQFAGKSGTAQVVGIAQGEKYDAESLSERQRDHALFVAFAPLDKPKIAVAVIVENGEGGSTVAGPIAKKILDSWLLDRDGEIGVRSQ